MSCQVQPSLCEQPGDVVEGAAHLRAEVADVHALAVLVDGGRAGDQQNVQAVQVDAHAARERTRLGIGVGFVEHVVVGHGALFDRRVGDGLQNFCKCNHDDVSLFCTLLKNSVAQSFGRGHPDVVALEIDAENVVVRRRGRNSISVTLPFASRTVISGLPVVSDGR